jgi:hypothetical protein
MGVEQSIIKERISFVEKEYAVLKEDTKLDECGWSNGGIGERIP